MFEDGFSSHMRLSTCIHKKKHTLNPKQQQQTLVGLALLDFKNNMNTMKLIKMD